MQLSIIVPCFNEARNLPLILKKFSSVINRDDIEVLLVDNGSNDNSKAVLKNLLPIYRFARVISVKENQGYGFGITSGLCEAKGEFIGYTHADMQTDPGDVIKAYEIIQGQASPRDCYVKGIRIGRPIFDQFFTKGMSVFETLFLGTKLSDINAQPNVFHRSFFDKIKNGCPSDFSLDLYILYMAKKTQLNVKRFDVIFPERVNGESSWNTGFASKLKFIRRTLIFSLRLKKEL